MKKQSTPILIFITVAFAALTIGFYAGRNYAAQPVTLSVPSAMQTEPPRTTEPVQETLVTEPPVSFPIDLNTAGERELTALPGIGEVLAQRILAYREENGRFSTVEELLCVEGIGKTRFEDIFDLVTIGG